MKLSRSAAHAICRDRGKYDNIDEGHKQFCRIKYPQESQLELEVYQEVLRLNSLSQEKMTSLNIRTMAQEYARDPKYGDFFKNRNFGQTWVKNFKNAFGI